MDTWLRLFAIVGVGAATLIGLVGGWLTPVAGRWRDDERLIELRRWGPFVRGTCRRPGGLELYKGTALFGRLTLRRFVLGAAELERLGFEPRVVPLLEGRPLAELRLRLADGRLTGTFVGRHFRFAYEPTRLTGINSLEPVPRTWLRAKEDDARGR